MICCVYVTVVVFLVFWAPIRSITSLRALFPMQKIRENQSGIVNVSIKSSIVNECTSIPYSKDLFLVHYGTYWNQAMYIVYAYIIVFKRAANLIIHYIQVWKLVTLHDIFFFKYMYLVVKVEKNFQMQDFFSWMKVLDHLKKKIQSVNTVLFLP